MLAAGTVNITTMVRCCDVAANTPQANVAVIAVNADGNVAGTATTDAQGHATLTIREGATVTAIYPEEKVNQETFAISYVGVKPNDSLTYGDAYYTPNQTLTGTAGQMTINWPAVTGAYQYRLITPCESPYTAGLTYSISLQTYCQMPTAPIGLFAVDTNYEVISSVYLPAAAFTVGATVNVTAGQWVNQAVGNYTVSISGLPASVYEADFDVDAKYAGFNYDASNYVIPKSGAGSVMISSPTTVLGTTAHARLYRNNYSRQDHYKPGPSPVAFPAPTLPWLSGLIFNPEDRHALWLQTAGTYDASILETNWTHSAVKEPDHYFRWRVILPPGVTEFAVGTPPAELAPYLPGADDSVGYELTLVDLSSAASYDAARALPEWRLADASSAVDAGDEPLAQITQYDGGEGFTFTH